MHAYLWWSKKKILLLSGWKIVYLEFRSINPCPAEPGYALSLQEDANWSGSALFAIKYVTLYQQSGSNNLIGWKLGGRVYSAWQGLRG